MNPALLPAIHPWLAVAAFLFGACVGSFLNVVAHRLPLGLSVVRPRSRCPACLTPIRALDNVPLLSWVLLGGRCRGCKARISARYPGIEALSGLLSVHVVWAVVLDPARAAEGAAWAHAAVLLVATAALLAASLVDFDHRILPDQITIPGMWAGPAVAAFVPELVLGVRSPAPDWVPAAWPVPLQAALVSAAGLAVGAGVVWGLGAAGSAVLRKEAMGFGDVKFLGMIGGLVGPGFVLVALVLAALVGSLVGLARLLVTGDRYIPFGPFLAVGGYLTMLHGPALVSWYLGLL